MSVEKRVTFTDFGEPVVTIKITGFDDAFRFAWAMAHLQCDFSDVGRRIGGSLRRHIGAARFRELHEHYTSNRTLRWVRDDESDSAPTDANDADQPRTFRPGQTQLSTHQQETHR